MLSDPVLGAYSTLSHLTFPAHLHPQNQLNNWQALEQNENMGSVVPKVGKKCHYNY